MQQDIPLCELLEEIMIGNVIELIYREYYPAVFQYCRTRLNGDFAAAEDCTQEVFLVLTKKIKKLVELESILPWLYRTADLEIKKYRRKNPVTTDIDEIPEPAAPEHAESPLDILDEEERRLVELYYSGADKFALAEQMGISLDALYKRIHRIRAKLKAYMDNPDK